MFGQKARQINTIGTSEENISFEYCEFVIDYEKRIVTIEEDGENYIVPLTSICYTQVEK